MTKIATTGIAARPRPRPGVLAIDPYVPGKSSAPGAAKIFKLSANETPLGPSPRARRPFAPLPTISKIIRTAPPPSCARRSAPATGSIRPESSAARARMKSSIFSPPPISVRATKAFSRSMVFSSTRSPSSPRAAFPSSRRKQNLTADVDQILAKVGPRTKMVFLANPNNPTGTYLPFAEVERLAAAPARPCAPRSRRGLCRICDARRIIRPAWSLSRDQKTS